MENRTSKDYAHQMVRYLDRFVKNRTIKHPDDLIEVIEKSTSKKNMILALRNLINFCEGREIISSEFANLLKKDLKCVRSQTDGYIPSDEDLIKIYQEFDNEDYKIIFRILAFSGLRVREAINFINEFDRDKLMINGKIAKYPLFLDRKEKKSYFAYLPFEFAEKLNRTEVTEHGVKKYFVRRGLPAKYLRKWNYNFLILNGVACFTFAR